MEDAKNRTFAMNAATNEPTQTSLEEAAGLSSLLSITHPREWKALIALALDAARQEGREWDAKECDYIAQRSRNALKGGTDGAEFNRAAAITAESLANAIRTRPQP